MQKSRGINFEEDLAADFENDLNKNSLSTHKDKYEKTEEAR
jgi:hypothetical protein